MQTAYCSFSNINWTLVAATAASCTSLFALITLYYNVLRPAAIKFSIHDRVLGFSNPGTPQTNKPGLLIGMTINNAGAKTGVISKISIQLTKREKGAATKTLNWEYFYKETNRAQNLGTLATHTDFDAWAHPLIIPGKTVEVKFIRFLATEPFSVPPGNYNCTFIVEQPKWLCPKKELTMELVITHNNAGVINAIPQPNAATNTTILGWA